METNKRAFHWHWVGLSSIGLSVGYFVTLSASPVVATLLPLLFGAIAGVSGFILGKTDFSKPESVEKIHYWGVGFFAFSVSLIISSIASMYVANSVFSSDDSEIIPSGISSSEVVELVALRKKLKILGASSAEQKSILALELKQLKTAEKPDSSLLEGYVREFIPLVTDLISSLQGLTISDEELKNNVDELKIVLGSGSTLLQGWKEGDGSNTALKKDGVVLMLGLIKSSINSVLGVYSENVDASVLVKLSGEPKVISLLLQAKAYLLNAPSKRSDVASYGARPAYVGEAEKLVELLVTNKSPDDLQPNIPFRVIAGVDFSSPLDGAI